MSQCSCDYYSEYNKNLCDHCKSKENKITPTEFQSIIRDLRDGKIIIDRAVSSIRDDGILGEEDQ